MPPTIFGAFSGSMIDALIAGVVVFDLVFVWFWLPSKFQDSGRRYFNVTVGIPPAIR